MSITNILSGGNDRPPPVCYLAAMAASATHWFLKEWLTVRDRTQQWLADEMGKQKSEISRKANGVTPYTSDDIGLIARLLLIEPYELLMHPDEARQMRRLRLAMDEEYRLKAVAEERRPFAGNDIGDESLRGRRAG